MVDGSLKIFEKGLSALIEEVEQTTHYFFHDAEEIGTSDISAAVRAVIQGLTGICIWEDGKADAPQISDMEIKMVRNAVQNCISRDFNRTNWEGA